MSVSTNRAVILMYHRLAMTLPTDPGERIYTLSPYTFRQQMAAIARRGLQVIGLDALATGQFSNRSVVLTFDDGCDSDLSEALPVLRDFDFRACFFVSPARLGETGYLCWSGLERLAAAGMQIGAHGLDHSLLDGLSQSELEHQLGVSKQLLEQRLGTEVDTVSLPGGSGGKRVLQTAYDLGYRMVLGSRPGVIRTASLSGALPRFALRCGSDLEGFCRLVDQEIRFVGQQVLRYSVTRFARAALGPSVYERLIRAVSSRRYAGPPSERTV